MIDLPILFQFLIILATHFVADFMLQTHWQASNKSRNNLALLEHVAIYTVFLSLVTGTVLFGFGALWFAFVWINAVMHFCTDYVTSRVSSHYFRMAIDDMDRVKYAVKMYGDPVPEWAPAYEDINPAKRWHNFFVVIGLDQLIHQTTLGVTLWMIV